jgi:hypothetical protein
LIVVESIKCRDWVESALDGSPMKTGLSITAEQSFKLMLCYSEAPLEYDSFSIRFLLVKNDLGIRSDKNSHFAVIFPEFFWGQSFTLFKNPVEVGEIVESAVKTNFRNGLVGIYQVTGGYPQAEVIQIFNVVFACAFFHKTAEGHFRHVDIRGHIREAKFLPVVFVKIVDDLAHPSALGGIILVDEHAAAQNA